MERQRMYKEKTQSKKYEEVNMNDSIICYLYSNRDTYNNDLKIVAGKEYNVIQTAGYGGFFKLYFSIDNFPLTSWYNKNSAKIYEVHAYNITEIIECIDVFKTNHIKILREIPFDEYSLKTKNFKFDERRNLICSDDGEHKTIREYDENDNLTYELDTYTNGKSDISSKYTYDKFGHLIKDESILFGKTTVIEWEYDYKNYICIYKNYDENTYVKYTCNEKWEKIGKEYLELYQDEKRDEEDRLLFYKKFNGDYMRKKYDKDGNVVEFEKNNYKRIIEIK